MTYLEMQKKKFEIAEEIMASQERTVLRMYRQRRDEVLSVLKENYSKYLSSVDPDDYVTVMNSYKRLEKMNKEFKAIYIGLNNGSRAKITAGQKALFEETYYRNEYTMFLFQDEIGTDLKFQALNPLVRDVSVTGDLDLLREIRGNAIEKAKLLVPPSGDTLSGFLLTNNTDALKKLQRTVKQGLANGESYSKQARRVKDVFNGNASNVSRVIRTEGNRNMNAGAYANTLDMQEQGVPIKREWVATLDDRTRDRHQSLDGQRVDVGEKFCISGECALYPGSFPSVGMNVNCRCATIDIVEGLEPQLRRGRNPVTGKTEIASYRNYDEWLEMNK